jgi:hypothetical protein
VLFSLGIFSSGRDLEVVPGHKSAGFFHSPFCVIRLCPLNADSAGPRTPQIEFSTGEYPASPAPILAFSS